MAKKKARDARIQDPIFRFILNLLCKSLRFTWCIAATKQQEYTASRGGPTPSRAGGGRRRVGRNPSRRRRKGAAGSGRPSFNGATRKDREVPSGSFPLDLLALEDGDHRITPGTGPGYSFLGSR